MLWLLQIMKIIQAGLHRWERLQLRMQVLTGCIGAHRTSGEGECEASEGSFMCEDMLRAGYQRFIVDPGTRQAYFPETARKLYTDQVHHNTHRAKAHACLEPYLVCQSEQGFMSTPE